MIILFIKSAISIVIVYALYVALLTRENMLAFKRFYLISGLLFSIIVPFVNLPISTSVSHLVQVGYTPPPFENIWITYTLYLTVSFILSIRFMLNLIRLVKLKKDNQTIQLHGYNIALISNKTLPFSFFNYIFVNAQDYTDGKISKELLLHEFTHVQQGHSIDIVFIELLQVIFWLNPFILLIKKEIKINHEYLADRGVISAGIGKQSFQNFLLDTVAVNSELSLTSCFSSKLTKKRLLMLNISTSPMRKCLKAAILTSAIIYYGISISYNQPLLVPDINNPSEIPPNREIISFDNNPLVEFDFFAQDLFKQQDQCNVNCQDLKQ